MGNENELLGIAQGHGTFKDRLRALRLAKGMSQSDLARACWGTVDMPGGKDGQSYPAARYRDRISEYEGGKAKPRPLYLNLIADVLGVTPEFLAPDLFHQTVGVGVGGGAGVRPGRFAGGDMPPFEIQAVDGGRRAWLQVHTLVSMDLALRIIGLLTPVVHPEGTVEADGHVRSA